MTETEKLVVTEIYHSIGNYLIHASLDAKLRVLAGHIHVARNILNIELTGLPVNNTRFEDMTESQYIDAKNELLLKLQQLNI